MSVEEALKLNERLKLEDGSGADSSTVETKTPEKNDTKSHTVKSKHEPNEGATNQKVDGVTDDTKEATTKVKKKVLERSQSKQTRSVNLVQQCINCFKEFFHTLVSETFIKSEADLQTYFQQILISHSLSESTCRDNVEGTNRRGHSFKKVDLTGCSEECMKMFSSVCNLLVEFASFPMYGQQKVDRDKPAGTVLLFISLQNSGSS